MLLDNQIYGLTKAQSSPTTPRGESSMTHPQGTQLSPINPLAVTLGITNVSFVAQTVDWNPPHLYATLRAAHRHDGLSFVRVVQRCPHYMPHIWESVQQDPNSILLLAHENGIRLDDAVSRVFKNRLEHDPHDLNEARAVAVRQDVLPIGLLYHNPSSERYDRATVAGLEMSAEERLQGVQQAMDAFLI
jgi:2-oxoglutarate ferredoxin oxidoreductase subunit beta